MESAIAIFSREISIEIETFGHAFSDQINNGHQVELHRRLALF